MIKKLDIKGFEGHRIEVNTGGLIFRPALLLDGKRVEESFWGNKFNLVKNNGTKIAGRWKMQLLGLDTPQLEVENKIYPFVEPNPWYVILWSAIPVLLFTRNLLWGTLYGLVGFSINLRAFHTERKMWVKYLITGAISVGWILFFILFEPAILFPLPSK